jgi:hypothetical protein
MGADVSERAVSVRLARVSILGEKQSKRGRGGRVFEDSIYPIVAAGLADFVEPEDCPCEE